MRNKILSIVFLLIVMVVPLATMVRQCLSKETNTTGNTANFSPVLVVDEFLDNVPFREKIARFNTKFTRKISSIEYINSTQVILGKNGWLYLKDTQEDYERTNCFSEHEKRVILDKLLSLREVFTKTGIEFVVYFAPNKATLYPENMPDTIFQRDAVSRIDDLIKYICDNSDIKVIFPKEELEAAKKLAPVYYVTDTHWNEVGGYVGAQVLLREVFGFEDKLLPEMIGVREEYRRGDLAKISSLADVFKEYTLYNVNRESLDTSLGINKKIYCIGDSFWEAIEIYIPYYLQNCAYVHYNNFNALEMYEYEPDVVVLEIVERSLPVCLTWGFMGDIFNDTGDVVFDEEGNVFFRPNASFKKDSKGVRYMADGEFVTDSLIEAEGYLCYFDEEGYMLKNSFKTVDDYTYYFGELGVARSGWVLSEDEYYYFDDSFHMVKGGWIKTKNDAWYYMTEDGTMLTDAYTPDGYYVNETGQWLQ